MKEYPAYLNKEHVIPICIQRFTFIPEAIYEVRFTKYDLKESNKSKIVNLKSYIVHATELFERNSVSTVVSYNIRKY